MKIYRFYHLFCRTATIVFFFFLTGILTAQTFPVSLTLKNFPDKMITLSAYYGEKLVPYDSAKTTREGTVRFQTDGRYLPGLYRFSSGKNIFLDFIFNHEEIDLRADPQNMGGSIEVEKSEENRIYYDFLKKFEKYGVSWDLLNNMIDYYPEDDPFYKTVKNEYVKMQVEYISGFDDVVNKNPGTIASRIIHLKTPVYCDPAIRGTDRLNFMRSHYFDNLIPIDTVLFRSNIYTNFSIQYMTLFSNPNFRQDELEGALIMAVDTLMKKFMADMRSYEFITEYLTGGFEKYHFDKVLDHIALNYTPEQCESDQSKSELEKRLARFALLASGKKAPDIRMNDINGKPVVLSDIPAEYKVVVFWATWCPHCNQVIPEMKKIYDNTVSRKYEILAISLDTAREAWSTFVTGQKLNWINCCDTKSRTGKPVVDYNIYATPTIFILDKNNMILSKPITLAEFRNDMREKGLIE
jgi:peroxiredoxin